LTPSRADTLGIEPRHGVLIDKGPGADHRLSDHEAETVVVAFRLPARRGAGHAARLDRRPASVCAGARPLEFRIADGLVEGSDVGDTSSSAAPAGRTRSSACPSPPSRNCRYWEYVLDEHLHLSGAPEWAARRVDFAQGPN